MSENSLSVITEDTKSITSKIDSLIDSITDAKSAKVGAVYADSVHDMLEAADLIGEAANEYCHAEARLWVRISEIPDGDELLKKSQQELVAWIRSKSEDQVDGILATCKTGIRIRNVMLKDTEEERKAKRLEAANAEHRRVMRSFIDEYEMDGRVSVSKDDYLDRWQGESKPNKVDMSAYLMQTRHELLAKNAIGLGDGECVYINPRTCSNDEKMQAISNRLECVLNDLRNISAICRDNDIRFGNRSGIDLLYDAVRDLEGFCDA